MKIVQKVLVGLLIVSFANPCFPEIALGQVGSEEEEITRHTPEIRFSADEDIPTERKGKAGSTWLWIILGALVVGGVVALAASSGGGGGNGGGGSSGTGSAVTVGW